MNPVFLVLLFLFHVLALAWTSTAPGHSATCSKPYKIQNFLLLLFHVNDLWSLLRWYPHVSLKFYNTILHLWTLRKKCIIMEELKNKLKMNLEEILFSEYRYKTIGTQQNQESPSFSINYKCFICKIYLCFSSWILQVLCCMYLVATNKFLPWTVLHHAQLYWLLKVQELSGAI